MSTLKQDILTDLRRRRQKVLDGGINCIPLSFPRFRQEFPGIEKGRYYVVTGATKASKTQIANYLFVYNTVLYIYNHPGVIRAKIFFFPLEETKEQVTLRFMAFLIHYLSKGTINISPTDLKSTDERKPVSDEILSIMESLEFSAIFDVYDSIVEFCDSAHPTGIFKTVENYFKAHGTIHYKELRFEEEDEFHIKREVTRTVFDKYIPDDPEEIVIALTDHVGMLSLEKDTPTIKLTIERHSSYGVQLRNKYGCTIVNVQQQNTETTNLEAFKNNKIRPTKDGLKDSKRTGEDCDVLIGMTCPNVFELDKYMGYDVTKFRDYFKVLEVVLNRHGRANTLCPLYHDGSINYYRELPRPDETSTLSSVYAYMQRQQEVKRQSAPIQEQRDTAVSFIAWARNKFKLTFNN